MVVRRPQAQLRARSCCCCQKSYVGGKKDQGTNSPLCPYSLCSFEVRRDALREKRAHYNRSRRLGSWRSCRCQRQLRLFSINQGFVWVSTCLSHWIFAISIRYIYSNSVNTKAVNNRKWNVNQLASWQEVQGEAWYGEKAKKPNRLVRLPGPVQRGWNQNQKSNREKCCNAHRISERTPTSVNGQCRY